MKPTLIIMCGVAGVGKDYAIKNSEILNDPNDPPLVVSRDKIRFEMVKDDEDYFARENDVFNEFVRRIVEGLEAEREVIANATHITSGSRKKLIKAIRARTNCEFSIVCYAVVRDIRNIIWQNNCRVGRERVPEEAINKMYRNFEVPSFKEDEAIGFIVMENYLPEPTILCRKYS